MVRPDEPEVVALARALADAAEGGQSAVLAGQVVDQLLDKHGLADAGAAEQADLAALGVGRQQVDHLDAGLEDLARGREVLDARCGAVDRPALLELHVALLVDRVAEQVEDAPERAIADRHGDRAARVADLYAARQAVGSVHRDRADTVVTEVLLHLEHERRLLAAAVQRDLECVVDLGQVLRGKGDLHDDTLDLLHGPGGCLGCCFH
jgi:hypothetical protein